MRSVYNRVRAKVYFLTPEEGGRSRPVPPLDPGQEPYFVLADLGFGYTEQGFPIRCLARVEPEGSPGYIELGVEQTVQIGLQCPEHAVKPGASFDLAEGRTVVARATVLSVLK
jgi:hypothetical protein